MGTNMIDYAKICELTGKHSYYSRSDAKQVMRKIFPTEKMSAYRCDVDGGCGFFHIGHTPYSVQRGFRARGTFTREG